MLVLKRKVGQWVEITHTSGDVLRICLGRVEFGYPSTGNLVFDDDARNFAIERPERHRQPIVSGDAGPSAA